MSKTFWAIVAVIVIIFGGIIIFNKNNAGAPATNAKPTEHIMGDGTSGVKLTEYGDYQCIYCGQYYPLVKQVVDKYKTQIHFQFRNLPLVSVHPHALAAARAAEAASNQGKFWEMHDLLYQNQSTWSDNSNASKQFEQYASQLGLNLTQFKKDVASPQTNDVINADTAQFGKDYKAATGSFNASKDTSTPTFFLDGKKITPKSVDEFSKLIDAAIAAKQKS